jgi:hypothetical protein
MFRAVCSFFSRELGARRLRTEKSELFARIFMGSLHHYCMSELFAVASNSAVSRTEFTEGLVDVLLGAAGYVAPASPARPPRRRAARP